MLLAIHYPHWLTPEIIPGFPLRWYGLMYVVAFSVAYLAYRRQVKERNFPMSDDDLSGLFFWCILALLVGARVFSTMVYEVEGFYRRQPWLIFWPFRDGQFTGLQGMSFHGGVLGGVISIFIYSKIKKWDFREIGDMYAASIPLGFTFGRLGNFLNGELYGRITASPIGMYFPYGAISPFHRDFAAIQEFADQMGIIGITGPGGFVNFPRHPSQLYQMIFEGIVLWAIIWFFRNRKPFKGFLITLYLCGYGLFRFVIEYFRQPDLNLGYRIQLVQPTLPMEVAHPLLCFTTGQVLSFLMIVAGLVWAFFASRMEDREPIFVYPDEDESSAPLKSSEEKAEDRKRRRKMRNKLR